MYARIPDYRRLLIEERLKAAEQDEGVFAQRYRHDVSLLLTEIDRLETILAAARMHLNVDGLIDESEKGK